MQLDEFSRAIYFSLSKLLCVYLTCIKLSNTDWPNDSVTIDTYPHMKWHKHVMVELDKQINETWNCTWKDLIVCVPLFNKLKILELSTVTYFFHYFVNYSLLFKTKDFILYKSNNHLKNISVLRRTFLSPTFFCNSQTDKQTKSILHSPL